MLRLDSNNLMRKVTCNSNLRRPYQEYKQTGAPRANWYEDNVNRVYARFGNNDACFDYTNPTHVEIMKNAASNKEF